MDRLTAETKAITDGTLGLGLPARVQEMSAAGRLMDRLTAETKAITDGALGIGLAARVQKMSAAGRLMDRLTAEAKAITDGALGIGLAARVQEIDRLTAEIKAFGRLDPFTMGLATIGDQAAAPIQDIGRALKVAQPFDGSVTAVLRDYLGDWRGLRVWPEAIIDNGPTRTDFYRALGFDDRLTSMPESTFYGCLDRYGVQIPVLPRLGRTRRGRGLKVESELDKSLARNSEAYDLLLRFEMALRRFIEGAMTRAFGRDWEKHRVPGEVYQNWKDKRQHALDAGGSMQPLINYADFTDYPKIIAKRDNWREVFRPIFKRREDVQEAFCRLHPIRLCTMHARIITADDQLLLRVETRRILRGIGIIS
jgi:hypothetical protein